jgi:GNAT superfamily N-acetyltransferase
VRFTSLADAPEGAEAVVAIERDLPPFLAELTRHQRDRLAEVDPACTWLVHDDDLPVASVRAVRLRWDGDPATAPGGGAGEVMARAGEPEADTLVVVDVTVAFGARGRGIGAAVLRGLEQRAVEVGAPRLLVLLRPHAKAAYPLVPFGRYVSATVADGTGSPFDPWLRAAWDAGLVPARAVDRSLVARAELDVWQRWLGGPVPGSGPYLVEGAIKPAIVEVERGEGRYREPHLWAAPRRLLPDAPADWVAALAAIGVVAGDRSHREVRRER